MIPQQFRALVFKYYKAHGRHDLPWRSTHDTYRILVSEVMLQQTQVERVRAYYTAWMKKYPTAKALAGAPLGEVLKSWQGLGYNRRAKALHETAKAVTKLGKFPKRRAGLEALPGIGPYTAGAVMAFAYNVDVIFIETNIRTAVTHHFYPKKEKVDDKLLLKILQDALPKGKSREWYSALMDYGAHLKQSGVRINAKAKGYTKQSKFAGSDREARGAILKELAKGTATQKRLLGLLGDDRTDQLEQALGKLQKEGMVTRTRSNFALPT